MNNTLDEIIKTQIPRSRLIGFDVGDRRIGLSISDTTWTIASPLGMLDRQKNWQNELRSYINQFSNQTRPSQNPSPRQISPIGIAAFVVGFPLLLNGDTGPQALKIQQFAEQYLTVYNLPILFWDERLSTHGANRPLMEADMSRAKRKVTIDKMSAVFILQGVLDRIKSHQQQNNTDID